MFHSTLFVGLKQFYLSIWLKKRRLENPFRGDNLNTVIKTSNCENLVLYFSEKIQKIAALFMLLRFSVTKQSLENGFSFPQLSEMSTLPASLKI